MSGNWKEVHAQWAGGESDSFIGHNQSGGSVNIGTIDGKPGVGPMEMLLLGVAGCTGIDITSILRKQKQMLTDFRVVVRGLRADTTPKVYTEIEVIYLLWGDDLNPKFVEQAIKLSEEKYCSASIMMRATAKFSSTYRIMSPGELIEEPSSV
jgi:putative redox protein